MKIAADIRLLLIALWLGAALFFSFAVAQSAFAVLPSRELAGTIVNRTLEILNYSGLAVGLLLLATSFVARPAISPAKRWAERILLLVLAAACAFGQFVIGAKLGELRRQIGRPIDELARDDAARVAFNNLHGYSVIILLAAMLAALIAFFLLVRRSGNGEYR